MSDEERKTLDARAVLPAYMQDPEKKVLVGGASEKDVEDLPGAFLQEEPAVEAPVEEMPVAEEAPAEEIPAAEEMAAEEEAAPEEAPAAEEAPVAEEVPAETVQEAPAEVPAEAPADEETAPAKKQGRIPENLKMILKDVLIACCIALLISCFISPTIVRETSMQPTIQPNDYLLMSKQAYRFGDLERGDIIIFHSELRLDETHNKLLIKRAIALPGDRLAIKDGEVYVNGEKLVEDYIYEGGTPGDISEMVIPEGKVFVMGDHRTVSVDSRALGCIDVDTIEGKAIFRLLPLKNFGTL